MPKGPSLFLVSVMLFFALQSPGYAQIQFAATLNPGQEVPPPVVTGNPSGTGTFVLSLNRSLEFELSFQVVVSNLSGPILAAHFHNGPAGVAAPVVRGFTSAEISGNTITGVWRASDRQALTPRLVRALVEGEIYVNVHTALNPPGEIRGQVIPVIGLSARMDSSQEVPPVAVPSGARGVGSFTLRPSRSAGFELAFDITFDGLTSPLIAAHFHRGAAGVAGPVVRGFISGFGAGEIVGNTISGLWRGTDSQPLTPALLKALMNGEVYVNVHTANNPPGEIRGQVVLDPEQPVSISFSSATVARGQSFNVSVANGANLALDVLFTFTPPGGTTQPPQVLERWVTLDANGRVSVLVDPVIPPGTYTVIGIRRNGTSNFFPANASITVQ